MPAPHPSPSAAACCLWAASWLAGTALVCGPAQADDKAAYTLFNPTPISKLREFDPDRPGLSHDPTTVDAGHVQVEIGAFEHVFDPRGPANTTMRRYTYGDAELRVGLTENLEFQITVPAHVLAISSGQDGSRGAGIGDTLLGAKLNLIGNDRGENRLALLPMVKLPTAPRDVGNGYAEYMLAIPYNYEGIEGTVLTLEPSIAALRSTTKPRYRDGYGVIVGVDQTIAKVVVASMEVGVQASTDRKERTMWTAAPSLAYNLTKNLQLDGGVYLGLNKATPRYNPYLGVSARF